MNEVKRRVLRCNGVEIHPGLGLVRRDNEDIYLRSKTHQFLLYLIEHRDGPVAKEDLLREVWEGVAVSDTTLFGCVKELRKALGDDARDPQFIRTLSKKGYWFVAPVEEVDEDRAEASASPPTVQEPETTAPAMAFVPAAPPPWRYWRWVWVGLGLAAALTAAGMLARTNQRTAGPHYGELAWWKLDEGKGTLAADSLNPLRGSVPPGVSFVPGVPGLSGTALRFEGNDLLVAGLDPALLPRGDMARTLMAWVKTASTNGDSTVIFRYGDPDGAPSTDSFSLQLHATGRAAFGNGIPEPLLGSRIDDGNWHQLVGVFDGAPSLQARLFVDGREASSGVMPENLLHAGPRSEWVIGRSAWGGTTFRGSIDDVRVFDRALNAHEVRSLHRCGSGAVDMKIDGDGDYFFSPIFGPDVDVSSAGPGEISSRVRNSGRDNSGVAFVKREAGCAIQSIRSSNLGQDLHISLDLKIGGSLELPAEGGPYFRSRRSAPGDGVIGGTSAGYWVQLQSDGQVRIKRMHPNATVAFTPVAPGFDPTTFHHVEVEARGEGLRVWLDGKELAFDVAGQQTNRVPIPPLWETTSPRGTNHGAAGVAFGCFRNRGQAGGQEARNIRIRRLP
ncbi:MAG: winged helix-turn-helix domain-containing protein [Acidobacteria bacterium]|nr:winged helix-turn-helix domain-containing protein [Acidobacteriota bacterium]